MPKHTITEIFIGSVLPGKTGAARLTLMDMESKSGSGFILRPTLPAPAGVER